MALNQQQIDQFKKDGFLSPLDVMSPDEAADYRRRLEEAEVRYPGQLVGRHRNNPHVAFPLFDELAHHPVIVSAAKSLLGDDVLICGTVLFVKEAHSDGFVSFHQDATYMGMTPHLGISAWIALTHSNAENGCMRMIPGSHRDEIRPHTDTDDDANILTRGQTVRDVDETDAVELILEPGQMSLHHIKTLHDSKPNLTADRRIGFTIQCYIPPEVRQTKGNMRVQVAAGRDTRGHNEHVARPARDYADFEEACQRRDVVNDDWSEILYTDSDKKRVY